MIVIEFVAVAVKRWVERRVRPRSEIALAFEVPKRSGSIYARVFNRSRRRASSNILFNTSH